MDVVRRKGADTEDVSLNGDVLYWMREIARPADNSLAAVMMDADAARVCTKD